MSETPARRRKPAAGSGAAGSGAAGPPAAAPWIDLRGVTLALQGMPILGGLELAVPEHGRLALVGPSGCGKSTLLRLVAGLIEPDGGTVAVGGQEAPDGRLAGCALMPQNDLLLPWRSALDNACIALENRGVARGAARAQALPLFERLGLGGFAGYRPARLSGGMRQRVAFLRTLLAQKETLLLDEPFGALDALTRGQTQEWLAAALAAEPRTVVLVTHDVEEAFLLADRVAVLSARPARVVRVFDAAFPRAGTRRETVTGVEFVRLRESALEALE